MADDDQLCACGRTLGGEAGPRSVALAEEVVAEQRRVARAVLKKITIKKTLLSQCIQLKLHGKNGQTFLIKKMDKSR